LFKNFLNTLDFGGKIKLYQFFDLLPQNSTVMFQLLFIQEKKKMMEI